MVAVSFSARPARAIGGTVQVDGKLLLLDQGFKVSEAILLVPTQPVVKALGGRLMWDEAASLFTLEVEGREILLIPGKASAEVNGHPVVLSAPVQVEAGVLYVPASFLVMQFGPRLRIDHPALKDPRAMQMLAEALKPGPDNVDVHSEMRIVIEEPEMLWMAYITTGERQVRGKDSLVVTTMKGPFGMRETEESAVKGGKRYMKVGEGWREEFSVGLGGPSTMPFPAPVPLSQDDLGLELLSFLTVEARLGEQRTEGTATLQDLHLTLNFGQLFSAMAGAERGPDGEPSGLDEGMPEFLIEDSTAMLTVDLGTGRVVSQQVDLALFVILPITDDTPTGMRMEIHARESITPNSTPIVWPAGLK